MLCHFNYMSLHSFLSLIQFNLSLCLGALSSGQPWQTTQSASIQTSSTALSVYSLSPSSTQTLCLHILQWAILSHSQHSLHSCTTSFSVHCLPIFASGSLRVLRTRYHSYTFTWHAKFSLSIFIAFTTLFSLSLSIYLSISLYIFFELSYIAYNLEGMSAGSLTPYKPYGVVFSHLSRNSLDSS